MLEKLVVVPAFLSSLVSGQDNSAIQHTLEYQKPPIYIQISELSEDEGLERRLAIYRDLMSKKGLGRHAIEMALEFYNDIIEESKNPSYLAEAYFNSGFILCCLRDPKNVGVGLERLNMAYTLGNEEMKMLALYNMFDIAINFESHNEKIPNLKNPRHYIREMEKLNPNDTSTKEAKYRLRHRRYPQTK